MHCNDMAVMPEMVAGLPPMAAAQAEAAPRRLRYVCSGAQQPVLRLFWFHHAGGSGASFRSMQALMPADWQIVWVEYAGHGENAGVPAACEMAQLQADLWHSLAHLLDRPYALFGHSMGALAAFGFARNAQATGARMPCWLGASGRFAPHVASALGYYLHKLSDAALAESIAALGASALELLAGEDERRAWLDLMRADLQVCETWQPALLPRLDCALTAFIGRDDPMIKVAQMQSWQVLCNGDFELQSFDGGHFYLVARKRELAAQIVEKVSQYRDAGHETI